MKTEPSPGIDCLIVINSGSSSLKFAVFPVGDETVLVKGLAERLGSPDAVLTIERDRETHCVPIPSATHHDTLADIAFGNTTYKAVQRSANLVSIGPVLQGLRKPVNDLSRGALVDDIIYTIAVTAIQSARD